MQRQLLVGVCAVVLLAATNLRVQAEAETAKDRQDTPASIACAQEQGESLGQCTYRVTQDASGKTTVTVAFTNGFRRMLFFADGKFLKGNATMSGVGTDTDWKLKDGLHRIRVDDQRFEIPDALVAASEPADDRSTSDAPEPPASEQSSASEPDAPAPNASKEAKPPVLDAPEPDTPQNVSAAADLAKGKKYFRKNCRACHGSKAQGVASYPKLAGQPAEYLAMRLKQYRAGERLGPNTPLMAPRAKKLTDEDITNIVAYIGTFD